MVSGVKERIAQRLTEQLHPLTLQITDDSAKHAGHAGAREGGESHFSIRIVSPSFEGVSRVGRHRLVYAALQAEFDQGLHALAITALAPGEA